ncbi:hypothetical protein [uncultured Celeribacter sp.]|uniref:hypothetical protein n=1 Tax=uncultured Celeribacter sp. TaxID=1303376 RepID=UPI002AA82372|nr:hypothetical protein [uncultured Celeribacter sp.]
MALVSNSAHAPGSAPASGHSKLTAREAEVIERLLNVCTHYQHIGDHQISELVDRIGMALMQAFMARNTPEANDA